MRAAILSILAITLLSVIFPSTALNIYVKPNDEECYFEELVKGEKFYAQYAVQSGGYLDIDVRVTGPNDQIVYEGEREKENSFQFKAQQDGKYKLCFTNSMSMVYGKTLSFVIYTGASLLSVDAAKSEHLTPLEQSIVTTSEGLLGIHDSQVFLKYREIRHSQTLESTNSRVMWWSILELIMLISVSTFNIMYLRALFDKSGNSMKRGA